MNNKQIAARLRGILNRSDVESDGILNRKMSSVHTGEIEVLLEHISLLVIDLKFDAEATRRELWEVRDLLEDSLNS